MTNAPALRRLASRAAANLAAVIAVTAIFGLKAYIDGKTHPHPRSEVKVHAFQITDADQ